MYVCEERERESMCGGQLRLLFALLAPVGWCSVAFYPPIKVASGNINMIRSVE